MGSLIELPQAIDATEITLQALTGYLDRIFLRWGTVNAGAGEAEDVLFVNGGAGDSCRVYSTSTGSPVLLTMEAPPVSHPLFPGEFALYTILYEPGSSDVAEQPYDIGTSCMPMPLSNGNIKPPPYTLVNTIGFEKVLGFPFLTGIGPAPCTIFDVSSLPSGTYTFQGYIFDGGSAGRGISLTNAIVLKVM